MHPFEWVIALFIFIALPVAFVFLVATADYTAMPDDDSVCPGFTIICIDLTSLREDKP